MKKIVCVLLALMLLTACGGSGDTAGTTAAQNTQNSLQIGGEEVTFAAWEQEGLPLEGAYYLTRDVELSAPLTVSGKLQLHLNGHILSGAAGTDFGSLITVAKGGELVICDAPEGTGAVVSPRSFTAKPFVTSMILVEGTVTLAGGTLDASAINLEDIANGACVNVADGGVLNIMDGTVIGGTTLCYTLTPEPEPTEPSATEPTGETAATEETAPTEETVPTEPVPAEPVEVMGKGGAVYLAAGSLCNLSGGTVTGGVAGLGGNFYLEEDGENPAKLVISGGTVTEGEAMFHGGNIHNGGIVEMSAGEISLGRSYCNGGNMVITGTLEMTGGTIREGRCDYNSLSGKRGANLLVNGLGAVVHISNAQILDGDGHGSENFGGNICVMGQCAREFSITDTTISGGQGHRGGNVYIGTLAKDVDPENLDFYMSNVTISGGSCSYRGANLCMDSDLKQVYVTLVMDNCTILMEDAGKETISLGAGAAADTWADLIMNGGAIEGGTLTLYGDATLTANGTKLSRQEFGGLGQLVINE